ncbi:MAG: hypothetical protein RL846_17690, partial [Deltaproteobacteria bacterium]
MRRALVAALLLVAACRYEKPLSPVLGYERDDIACSDGIDNDRDGLTDCDDGDCLEVAGHCGDIIPLAPFFERENDLLVCRDNIDNDDNGQFYCGDRKCQAIPEACCNTEFTN